jgi:hypothetical protein
MNRFRSVLGAGAVGFVLTLPVACGDGVPAPLPQPSGSTTSLAKAVVGNVLQSRTVRVRAAITHGSLHTRLDGAVEIDMSGVRADLAGEVVGISPARIIMIANDVYLQTATSGPWRYLAADGEWPFPNTAWAAMDLLLEALHYAGDTELLQGLTYTDGPSQQVDGVTVRSSVATVDGARFLSTLSEAQQRRFEFAFAPFSGATIQLYLDDQQVPRRMIASLGGRNTTVDVAFRDWGSAVPNVAPPANAS